MALFRIDELLQMAMHAEQAGMALYQAAAYAAKDPHVADLFHQLAAQEAVHYRKFAAIRDALGVDYAKRTLSVDEVEFVKSLARGNIVPTEEQARETAEKNAPAAVLDMAIQAERNSQEFYAELLQAVDAPAAATVRAIIGEEKQHELSLSQVRARMSA